jgi:hypothetical protein
MIGQKKSFHACMKVSMPSTAMAGRATGRTMRQKMRKVEAPSTRPASSSSVGSASLRYCRMKKTPKALTSVGRITAWRWFTHCSLAISMNSGMMPSCGGTIRVPMVTNSSRLRPRKRSLAKAKPARVENSTVPSAMLPATTVEFSSALAMFTWVSALLRLESRLPPGSSGGGTRLMAEFEVEAATIVQ